MIDLNLIFLESWDSEFKGKTYKMYRFIDKQSLTILTGTDLNGTYKEGQTYKCKVVFKNKGLKVVSAD